MKLSFIRSGIPLALLVSMPFMAASVAGTQVQPAYASASAVTQIRPGTPITHPMDAAGLLLLAQTTTDTGHATDETADAVDDAEPSETGDEVTTGDTNQTLEEALQAEEKKAADSAAQSSDDGDKQPTADATEAEATPEATATESEPVAESEATPAAATAESEPVAEGEATPAAATTESEPVAESEATPAAATAESEPVAEAEATPAAATTESEPVAESEATPAAATAESEPVAEGEATPAAATTESEPVAESEATPEAATTESEPVAESEATPEAATTESEPVAESTEPETASSTEEQQTTEAPPATSTEPAAEATSVDSGETTETTATPEDDTSTAGAPDATTVTETSEEEVKEATDSGKDVVVEYKITPEEQALIEENRKAALEAATSLEAQEPVTVKEEVVTSESTRTSSEEVKTSAASSAATDTTAPATTTTPAATTASTAEEDDDDDNQLWKYLGAAAAGAVVGTLIPSLGGKLVQDQGDRVIVEREGEFYVHKDENLLLRRPGVTVQTEEFAGGIVRDTVNREDGSQVVTVRDAGGFVLKRTSIAPDGSEYVLIDETRHSNEMPGFVNWDQTLPPRYDTMPGDHYIVDSSQASRDTLHDALMAPPVQDVGRQFTLRDVRDNERVRALMPRIDLDSVEFALGSAAIHPSQAKALTMVGKSMANVIAENPREVFLIEGHTDAVGSNLMNLALSDRRAEAVALALTEYFDIPPENLIVQGYGERYLKVDTPAANQANRRATVRRITPLIGQARTEVRF